MSDIDKKLDTETWLAKNKVERAAKLSKQKTDDQAGDNIRKTISQENANLSEYNSTKLFNKRFKEKTGLDTGVNAGELGQTWGEFFGFGKRED